MNNENCFYTIVIIVFAVVIALGYLLFTSEGNEAMKLCKVIVCVLAVACLSLTVAIRIIRNAKDPTKLQKKWLNAG